MSNDQLRVAVEDELLFDPKVDHRAVAVDAAGGVITLRGTVGSLRGKFEAEKAAKRVYGVKKVDDQLEVKILGVYSREDADVRGSVLQALDLDGDVPPSVDATAVNGVV